MMRGHIADSISLLDVLNGVYLEHVDYLVMGLTSQLQDCDRLLADLQIIINRAKSSSVTATGERRLQQLVNALGYLSTMLGDFDTMLTAEASHVPHYFPTFLLIDDCDRLFRIADVKNTVDKRLTEISSFVSSNNVGGMTAADIRKIADLRSSVANLTQCLLSYRTELDSFEQQLSTLTLTADFNYEPPTMSLSQFSMDGDWLDSIASQYVAGSLSKLKLSEDLHNNGSLVLTNVDQLYSDIELSLFSKAKDLIDSQEKDMVSFYKDLMKRVTLLQRYMSTKDTSLEQFMRRLSIWRMPILNFQKSQVHNVDSSLHTGGSS